MGNILADRSDFLRSVVRLTDSYMLARKYFREAGMMPLHDQGTERKFKT